MAYYCRTCRVVFERKYSNCHICGYGLQSDDRSVQEYINMGYEAVGKGRPAAPQPQADDSDILDTLRKGYATEYGGNTHPVPQETHGESRETQAAENEDFFARAGGRTTPRTTPVTAPDRTAADDEDFFSRNSRTAPGPDRQVRRRETPPVEPEVPPLIPARRPRNENFNFGNLWYGFLNVMYRIPWALVFRVVLVGLLIGGLVMLWNARFLILNSILNLISALIPSILTIVAIVYLIRSIFR